MIHFVLNNKLIASDAPHGMVLLDFIRDNQLLKGTKTVCKEGDCGACTVLVGELHGGELRYRTIVSCLSPLGAFHGKHVVTIEGLNQDVLSNIQQILLDSNATQCGFCTPGIVLTLTASLLESKVYTRKEQLIGNICRCTGYKSIEKAVGSLENHLEKRGYEPSLQNAIEASYIPEYFKSIKGRLQAIPKLEIKKKELLIGGGTDLFVQKSEQLYDSNAWYVGNDPALSKIEVTDKQIKIGAASSTSDILKNKEIQAVFPSIKEDFLLISSEQIRNMATIGGNIVNASPIGDLSIWLLALGAELTLINKDSGVQRKVLLKDFFLDYKLIDLKRNEFVSEIIIDIPSPDTHFSFEKVSKRQYLDIASVNTGCKLTVVDGIITECIISAGGVGPIPMLLSQTSSSMIGKTLSANTLYDALALMQNEIRPIDDIRGSAQYKSLLLRQLIIAHFSKCFEFVSDHLEVEKLRLS